MIIKDVKFRYYGDGPSNSRYENKIKYIIIHWTANKSKNANAEMHHRFYKNSVVRKNGKIVSGVSAHYTVDSEMIVQSVGDSKAAWTVGTTVKGLVNVGSKDGSAFYEKLTNENTINIEMCVNSDGNWVRTRYITLELTKTLMKRFGIPIKNVLRHYDALRVGNWRKNCPGNMAGSNWADWWKFKSELDSPIYLNLDLDKTSVSKGVLETDRIGKSPTNTVNSLEEKQESKGDEEDIMAQFDYVISITDDNDAKAAIEIANRHKSVITINGKTDYNALNSIPIVAIGGTRDQHTTYADYFISAGVGKHEETYHLARKFARQGKSERDKFKVGKK